MAPIRLRHPNGIATLQIPLDDPSYTVQDLQQEIYKASEILPSRQSLKTGYPPRPLTLVPELPLSSLDLKSGEQLIVQETALSSSRGAEVPKPQPKASLAQALNSRSPPGQRLNPPARPTHVEVDGGWLVHRIVPDDNSCLFSSLALIFEQSITKAPLLRKTVASAISSDPFTWSEAILGMPPPKYIDTISKPTSWGGAIELSILAKHYNTEIASVDVETGRIDRFRVEESEGENRCLLVYSGIHYDALTFSPMEDAPAEWHQCVFPIKPGSEDSDSILNAAKKLATALREKKAFTNTATFDLRCEQCGQGLKGEKGARAHAEETGHVRFGEY
ncbi:OTU-domain-containing protein [Coprinellus micaceus]|uniref:Ubiquitin thioesterase OTU n=1 Tax=Coprinellus micaceus TaxID=71717 RepID=A0A4Y7SXI4_COPMI|nr:OTU-domain-containing protein [Coprinellus micaceus]